LLDCLNCKTGKCCSRLAYIATRISKKRRVISAAISQLIEYGWLLRQRRRGSSNYRFAFERLQQDVQKSALHEGDDAREAASLSAQDSAHEDAQETAHLNTGNRESGNGNQGTVAADASNTSNTGVSAKPNSKQPRRRKTCLPEDWQPSEHALSFAKQCGLSEEAIPREVMKFKNYYIGKGILMVDWDRAWENWCIRTAEYADARRTTKAANRRSLVAGLWEQP
jgi:hypothetical protein